MKQTALLLGLCFLVQAASAVEIVKPTGKMDVSNASFVKRCNEATRKGRQFLLRLFEPGLGLLPEYQGSSVYWLYHDNYLAAKALEKSRPEIAGKIRAAIESYGIRESGTIEIVFGEAKRPLPLRHFQLVKVRKQDGKTVWTEVVTGVELSGVEGYADLLFLTALAENEPAKARQHFQRGMAMWDGKGFNDRVAQNRHTYAVFKLALALISADRLGRTGDPAIAERLLALQSDDGGWITDYDPSGRQIGKANVETTSLAILAVEAAKRQSSTTGSIRH